MEFVQDGHISLVCELWAKNGMVALKMKARHRGLLLTFMKGPITI